MHSAGRSILTAIAVTAVIGTTTACGAADDAGPATNPTESRAARPAVQPAPGDHTLAIDWAGQERTWTVHAPAGYRPGAPIPLVVAVHGTDQSPERLRDISGLNTLADAENFLVAYPKALKRQFSRAAEQGDDINFIRALVQKMVTEWSVDQGRVYATGFSSGAELTWALGVEAAEVFAAVAPVGGAFVDGPAATDPNYKPGKPVSVITFIGRDDRIAARMYSGLSRWQKNLNCTLGKPEWVDKTKTVNRTTSTCADGSQIVDYTVNGMGHAWPSASGYPAPVDATVAIWEFFAATPRR